jgi:hypothetical protein
MKERWTLLVVKGEDGPVRRVTLSPRALALGGLAAGALVAVLLVVALGLGIGATTRLESHQLRARNRALTTELGRLRGQVDGLEGTLTELAARDAQLRTLAGLDPIDDEVMEAGVGGPGMDSPESHPLYDVDASLGEAAFAVGYDLNALRRRARLLATSLDAAADSLRAHEDLLRATPSIMPATGYLSSRFSRSRMHPLFNEALPHVGVDISAPRGTPILASADGRVVRAAWVVGYGNTVEIDHGFGYMTLYGHASKLLARVGQRVRRGDVIALVGSTGIATSAHLHYEVRVNGRPQNPSNYILPGIVP